MDYMLEQVYFALPGLKQGCYGEKNTNLSYLFKNEIGSFNSFN
jgi:hypothetical protein